MTNFLSVFENKVQDQFNKMITRKKNKGRKVIPTSFEIEWDEEDKVLSVNFSHGDHTVEVTSIHQGDEGTQSVLVDGLSEILFSNSRTTWRHFDAMFDVFVDTLAEISVADTNQVPRGEAQKDNEASEDKLLEVKKSMEAYSYLEEVKALLDSVEDESLIDIYNASIDRWEEEPIPFEHAFNNALKHMREDFLHVEGVSKLLLDRVADYKWTDEAFFNHYKDNVDSWMAVPKLTNEEFEEKVKQYCTDNGFEFILISHDDKEVVIDGHKDKDILVKGRLNSLIVNNYYKHVTKKRYDDLLKS